MRTQAENFPFSVESQLHRPHCKVWIAAKFTKF